MGHASIKPESNPTKVCASSRDAWATHSAVTDPCATKYPAMTRDEDVARHSRTTPSPDADATRTFVANWRRGVCGSSQGRCFMGKPRASARTPAARAHTDPVCASADHTHFFDDSAHSFRPPSASPTTARPLGGGTRR